MPWTVEQVVAFAQNGSAARAARDMASARTWPSAGHSADAVWGECQGSASAPYRIAIDLTGPAFRCTCPSSRLPCKHALGLFLRYVTNGVSPSAGDPPVWVTEWLLSRRKLAARPPTATREPPADPARAALEQQKRARRREERIRAGVDDLERWLSDLARAGLAETASRPWSSFGQVSARLVDAQAPGLARLVRDLGALPHTTPGWPERMLISLGRLWLLVEGSRRLAELEPDLQAEIRSLIGIAEGRDDVLATPSVHDAWEVAGRRVIEGERLRVQRTWLWGRRTQRWALLLDFAAFGQPLEAALTPGMCFKGNLCFYSGVLRLRALRADQPQPVASVGRLPAEPIDSVLRTYAGWLGRNPWLERMPAVLQDVIPHRDTGGTWWAADRNGRQLPIGGSAGWHLLALSGGQPIDLFGEWDGYTFWPLSGATGGRVTALGALEAA